MDFISEIYFYSCILRLVVSEVSSLSLNYAVVVFNVILYIFSSLSLFLLLLTLSNRDFYTLNKLRNLHSRNSYLVIFIFLVLSLAGVPPLLGFVSKLLIYIQLLSTNSYLLFFVLLLFNTFVLYFYIQNIKYVVSKDTNKRYNFSFFSSNENEFNHAMIITVVIINTIGIFFFESFLNCIFFWFSF